MKRFSCLFLLSVLFFGCGSSGPGSKDPLEIITPELLNRHITFLASDSLKGRKTPGEDLDNAARYIAEDFKDCGLSPAGGSYFQKVPLGIVNLGEENSLVITSNGIKHSFSLKTGFTPFEMTGNKEAASSIVFAGYGITAPGLRYDDYKDLDVKGKIVLVLRHAPGEGRASSAFSTVSSEKYSQVSTKVQNAISHGAAGVIVVTDPLNHTLLSARGFPWPSLSAVIPKDALPVTLLIDEKDKVPAIQTGKEVIELLFGSVEKLKQLQMEIDSTLTPRSFEIQGTSVFIKTSTVITGTPASNVAGYIEGSDPVLKNEVVIIGAHYDHVGYKSVHQPGEDYIYNGADDNASGTGGLMAIARAFASMEIKPKRSLLFIAFAGEELGLLGSRAYTETPIFPLEKTAAMLNMDMIGRNNPDSLFIIGSSRCPELVELVKKENEKIGFKLGMDMEGFISGSDNYSFLSKGVPSVFFNTGETSYYHQLNDEASTINMLKASRVCRLVFLTALKVADDSSYSRNFFKPISYK